MLLLKTFKIMLPIKYYKYTIFKERKNVHIHKDIEKEKKIYKKKNNPGGGMEPDVI